ncbi:hypothetical protein FisN_10Hh305 [Fistulifera solaris]|jgi:hypothetical protein|uniref:Uncharacterized protein n=1 Tax=Fistulifera solaris TaxID=1519565 RepID=A0A1Z5JWU0_FISSO|nr:hypothetical protein FisN_10Hh305 [Fistulifera solaris]|eukprot:GAX18497.1 hypothetical protein FisN_10Hh305 [Fistulifera solaris]
MKGKPASDVVLGDLIWVHFPKAEHAARKILNKTSTNPSKIWVRWVSNEQDEEIPTAWIRELPERRRSRHQDPQYVDDERRPTPPKRKNRHPRPWPLCAAPFSQARVQERDIQVKDYVYRDNDLYRVSAILQFNKRKYPHRWNRVQLENVITKEIVYEDLSCVEPYVT